ncbi:MAG: ABC transporter permease, partial [Duncaniella sp.]|nr:ABC transporter permease [Duncaniella sp.]
MGSPLFVYIASRFSLLSTGSRRRSGLTTGIVGVALSLSVMIISIAVMRGFKEQIIRKVVGFESAITVAVPEVDNPDPTKPHLFDRVFLDDVRRILPEGASASFSLRHPALLKTQEAFRGASIKGLSSDSDTSFLSTCIVEGEL